MLQAYIDESGTGDPNHLVLAGFVAEQEVWRQFSTEWRARLDHAHLGHFHMHEMRNKPEIAGYFYRTVEQFAFETAIAVVINTKELVEVERSVSFPPYIKEPHTAQNPYFVGLRNIIGILAQSQHQIGIKQPVNFIFDDRAEKTRIPRAWSILKSMSALAHLIGDEPVFMNDKTTPPLQAADLYAWWILKWLREGERDWANRLPFPWKLKGGPKSHIVAYFGRSSFLYDISKTLEHLARNQKELDYARSLMPAEWR